MGCGQYVVATPSTKEAEKATARSEPDQVYALESVITAIRDEIGGFIQQVEDQDYRFSNKATDPLNATNESVECTVCLLRYNDHSEQPLSLPCGHVFCKSCLEEHYKLSGVTKCPLDRTEHDLAPNQLPLALHLIDAYQENDKALNCERHRLPLVSYCTAHKHFLCRRCSHVYETCLELEDPALEKELFACVVTSLMNRKMTKADLEAMQREAQQADEDIATSFVECLNQHEQASHELDTLKQRILKYCCTLDAAAEEVFSESRGAANAAHSVFQEAAKAAEFLNTFDAVPLYTKLSHFKEGTASLSHLELADPDESLLKVFQTFGDYPSLLRELNSSE